MQVDDEDLLLGDMLLSYFFFNGTATTEIYTLSLHDALPICDLVGSRWDNAIRSRVAYGVYWTTDERSEEHTSELQSQSNLVCRLLLEKKKKKHTVQRHHRSV